jgi:DNA-binding transcriptional ArsR family regulator
VATNQLAAWSALGDGTRRTIFELLTKGSFAVGELANGLPVSRPAVSQHLRVLKDAGLVSDQHVGNRRIYAINPDGLNALRTELDRFWTSTLAAYKVAVEQPEKEVP